MSSRPADVHPAAESSGISGAAADRRLLFLLTFLALTYAVFAGLRTVSDFDLGWQMATGRWIIQHHRIPSVDVLSYTAAGQPWIYPVGAGLIFYLAYLLGGYALLSWMGAAACVGTVALLLRRGSATTAAIAILAVPLIALRTTPRADMFTVVLFAAFLSILWEQQRTGRARLWLLPLLMIAWVNLHLGFVAGLALMIAYAVAELLDAVVNPAERKAAFQRLRRALPWLSGAALATLVNPWGWGIYRAIILQQRVNSQHEYLIAEWSRLPLTWSAIVNSLSLRQTTGAPYLLLAIAAVAAVWALLRAQLGPALLLLGATYAGIRYVRMSALFACVVVTVGGPIFSEIVARAGLRLPAARVRPMIAGAVVALFAVLVLVRCFDLAGNRFYLRGSSESTFGAGLSWWFPERAAEFLENHNLPGEVFNTYDEGGFVTWKLGPQRRNMIDGRAPVFGVQAMQRNNKLLQSSPDSPLWQEEANRYNLNTILLPLARYDGIELVQLQEFCRSTLWQPIYLDEVSAVFVRRGAPGTDDLLQRFSVDCASAPLPPLPASSERPTQAFNRAANAAAVLAALGRNSEALAATDDALAIFPGSSFAHWLRGNLLLATGDFGQSEQEYQTAVSLEPSDVTWAALADFYRSRGRTAEAIDAMKRAAALSGRPFSLMSKLGYFYLRASEPAAALHAFDQAERSAPTNVAAADNGTFDFMLAQGRSVAWNELGDTAQAISFQEKAAALEPDAPEPWRRLAQLYRHAGRLEDAIRADEHASDAEQRRP